MIVEWGKNEAGEAVMNIYDGEMVDDINGVMTNDPVYPVQRENLARYNNSTVNNYFYGIPGSIYSGDRFVRLAIFNQNNAPIDVATDTEIGVVSQAFSLLHTVEVVSGLQWLAAPAEGESKTLPDYTLVVVVRDHGNKKYYFKTAENQNLGRIDLNTLDFVSGAYHGIPVLQTPTGIPYYTDVTGDL
jgi:choloylglycine hydrolase